MDLRRTFQDLLNTSVSVFFTKPLTFGSLSRSLRHARRRITIALTSFGIGLIKDLRVAFGSNLSTKTAPCSPVTRIKICHCASLRRLIPCQSSASFAIGSLGFELGLVLGEAVTFGFFADGVLDDLAFHVEGATLLFGTGCGSLLLGGDTGSQVVEKAAAIGQDAPTKSR